MNSTYDRIVFEYHYRGQRNATSLAMDAFTPEDAERVEAELKQKYGTVTSYFEGPSFEDVAA